jgi:hypothetical protein
VQVLEGPRVPALAERALACRAELVVLGCGTNGSGGATLGGLARLLAVPVLLVPASVTASSGTRDAVESLMDEIGSQSFPASDPPAWGTVVERLKGVTL